jgi:hypothetical protein
MLGMHVIHDADGSEAFPSRVEMLRGVNDELELLAAGCRRRDGEDATPSISYAGRQHP